MHLDSNPSLCPTRRWCWCARTCHATSAAAERGLRPLSGRGVATRRAEPVSENGSIFTEKGDCERDNNRYKNGLATSGGATDVALADPLVVPLACGASTSSVDPSESPNIFFTPPVSPSEEPEEDQGDDDAEFALLESYLARLGVPPAFSPRRSARPWLKTPPTRNVNSTCRSENNQIAEAEFLTLFGSGKGDGQTATGTNRAAGVEFSARPVAGKRGHRAGTTTGCSRQPTITAESSSTSLSSAVTRRSARRRSDNHQSVTAAPALAAARRTSPTSIAGCNNNVSASLVDGRTRSKHGTTIGVHAFPVDGRPPSTTTTTTTDTDGRRDKNTSSGGEVVAARAVPKSTPPEDLPAARDGVEICADSEDGGSPEKPANGVVIYPPWREDKGPSFSDELRAVASGIRRQTRQGNGLSSVKSAGRSWNGVCRQRNSRVRV